MSENAVTERFSIEFNGKAFDSHEISAGALAQSLLALDGLSRKVAEAVYGKNTVSELKVQTGFRKGSFIADLVTYCENNETALAAGASAAAVIGGVYCGIRELIRLCKFAAGRKAVSEGKPGTDGSVPVINEAGEQKAFNITVINVYNQSRTRQHLSRLTQTLDLDGSDSIVLHKDGEDDDEVITREDRSIFRQEEGIVLTDNEAEVILEVIGPIINGSGKGWKFSEGQGGLEFTAGVEDEKFLQGVRNREIKFENGTTIRAVMRTVQRKNIRTITDRTIVEVKEVFLSEVLDEQHE